MLTDLVLMLDIIHTLDEIAIADLVWGMSIIDRLGHSLRRTRAAHVRNLGPI